MHSFRLFILTFMESSIKSNFGGKRNGAGGSEGDCLEFGLEKILLDFKSRGSILKLTCIGKVGNEVCKCFKLLCIGL